MTRLWNTEKPYAALTSYWGTVCRMSNIPAIPRRDFFEIQADLEKVTARERRIQTPDGNFFAKCAHFLVKPAVP
jgi:hypothetical protein